MQDLAGKRKCHASAMAAAEPMLFTVKSSPYTKQDYFKVLLSLKLQDKEMLMQDRWEQSFSSSEPSMEARTRVASGLEQVRNHEPVNAM